MRKLPTPLFSLVAAPHPLCTRYGVFTIYKDWADHFSAEKEALLLDKLQEVRVYFAAVLGVFDFRVEQAAVNGS